MRQKVIITRDVRASMDRRVASLGDRVARVSWAADRIWLKSGDSVKFVHEVVALQKVLRMEYDYIAMDGEPYYLSPGEWRQLRGRARK